jgi:hypothetical protein
MVTRPPAWLVITIPALPKVGSKWPLEVSRARPPMTVAPSWLSMVWPPTSTISPLDCSASPDTEASMPAPPLPTKWKVGLAKV